MTAKAVLGTATAGQLTIPADIIRTARAAGGATFHVVAGAVCLAASARELPCLSSVRLCAHFCARGQTLAQAFAMVLRIGSAVSGSPHVRRLRPSIDPDLASNASLV